MLVVALLLVLVGAAVVSVVRPGPPALVVLVAACVAWLLANGRVEGPVLWTFSPEHGLTTADLLVPPLLLLGVVAALRARAGRRRRARGQARG